MGCRFSATVDEEVRKHLINLCKRSIKLNRGKLVVRGVLHRAGVLNCNGRVYPKHVLEREVLKFVTEKVRAGKSFGELNHPNLSSETFRSIDVRRVSHRVVEMHWEGDALVGTIEILDTPQGRALRRMYLRGDALGVSSRGWATLCVEANGVTRVGDDFDLITFDYVSEPSTPGAYLLPVDYAYEGDIPEQSEITALAQDLQRRDKGASENVIKEEGAEKGGGFISCCAKSKIVHLCPPL